MALLISAANFPYWLHALDREEIQDFLMRDWPLDAKYDDRAARFSTPINASPVGELSRNEAFMLHA